MKLIIRYLRKFIGGMILGLSIKIVGTLMDLVLPYILAHIVDNVVPSGNRNAIFLWGGVMIFCSVVALVGNITANRMAARVARDTTKSIRHDLFCRVMYLSSEQLDKLTVPSLESRLTSDTFQIHRVVGMMQRLGVRAPILLFGGIFLAFFLDPVLTLIMIATLPFIGITVFFVSKKGNKKTSNTHF